MYGTPTPLEQITITGQKLNPLLPSAETPEFLTTGPDGTLWFIGLNVVGRINATGQVTTVPVDLRAISFIQAIAVGPDGALWFTAEGLIGRIT